MKKSMKIVCHMATVLISVISLTAIAQDSTIQYFRPNDKRGINIFETSKNEPGSFNGLKVKIGGNFTQDFQMLSAENNATALFVSGINSNQLMKLTSGFNLAMANLNIDVQLSDGIRLSLTSYLSTCKLPL
jgi:hypothetical protein